jgi:uncharacterized membrane protein
MVMAHYMKIIVIDAPPQKVFETITDLEKIKELNPHILEVRIVSSKTSGIGTRTHFVMETPSTGRVEWDEEITTWLPGQLYAFKTVGGEIQVSGRRLLELMPDGRRTRLTFVETLEGQAYDEQFEADIEKNLMNLKALAEKQ